MDWAAVHFADCEGTNAKLRDVYTHFATLKSPSGATYKSRVALERVDKICPQVEVNATSACDTPKLVAACTGVDMQVTRALTFTPALVVPEISDRGESPSQSLALHSQIVIILICVSFAVS